MNLESFPQWILLAAVSGVDGALEAEECILSVCRNTSSGVLESFLVDDTCQLVLDMPRRVDSEVPSAEA